MTSLFHNFYSKFFSLFISQVQFSSLASAPVYHVFMSPQIPLNFGPRHILERVLNENSSTHTSALSTELNKL